MARPLMSKTQNICLILLSILFILLACIMVRELLLKRELKEPDYNEISINNEMVTNAMKNWNFDLCDELDDYIKNMFNGNFEINELTSTDKLYIILKNNLTLEELSIEEINNKKNEMMDVDNLKSSDIAEVANKEYLKNRHQLNFDGNKLKVSATSSSACEKEESIITKLEKAEENGVHLNVYLKMAYGKELINDEGNKVIDYYKDIKLKNVVERVSFEDKGKIDLENYDTYKLTFKINSENYLLQSITL